MTSINTAIEGLRIPSIALGCMRISEMKPEVVLELITCSMEEGINFFDHADIYGGGKSEEVFAKALKLSSFKREDIILQSKCGIRDGFFDFSESHILNSVDEILKRLNSEYLDILLLHRPDTLMEPDEVASAFDRLQKSGKVKHFGVSNQNPMQIQLLQKSVNQKLAFNQLQLSLMRSGMIDCGLNVNMKLDASLDHDGGILDFCRLHDITIQAWSPFQYGFFEGVFLNNEKFPELNKEIDRLAEKYSVSNSAVALAWILRHPSGIQTVIGTTKITRIKEMAKAASFKLSREEWYALYRAAGNVLP
ncbi:aldo/keto reductase [Oceanispirochaeta sp. M2]|uniref:aldo/keto reductase n=2 Tax=Oceanispirochaeta TaxID=2035349 RepID=UPI000E094925|nr:aldo/keto reductase [Oceanispirochaeta sp. M1]MBF9016634.1 aldo/keto reductase [Oceanispirochaeta sp. M2]NPD73161.1 aldo/keto reductase [Oceanispirochaeta sp. M1]RDG31288.1 aldo/keto reductase family oxidoreductase [Oceanispirochaeta sp. M1]